MEKQELFERIEASGYEWKIYEKDGIEGVLIRCVCSKCLNTGRPVPVDFDLLQEIDWHDIERRVVNGRHVEHVTRVVGYYSKTSNWNRSKQGELKDRHRGRYRVGSVT